ncbi:Flp family type IVb pilin [Kineosporia babensis]|uniref:Flp family type IVb pilin n=1 Tax=Kineosporia babensis TaxID=499548 RepID=A0A9X1NAD1_9ACTN|nr:Flp family type IVb pilin [Kineosporia babensis]MCD5311537.1 Flp family type IVb pilin [Kineosporia babensis]
MLTRLRKVLSSARDRGASAVEYGLMVAAIAAVIVAVVFGLGTVVSKTFNKTCSEFSAGTQAELPAGCEAAGDGEDD